MYGNYFLHFVRDQGHERLLKCLGNNLFNWLANVNQVHNHLLYAMNKMSPPNIWFVFSSFYMNSHSYC